MQLVVCNKDSTQWDLDEEAQVKLMLDSSKSPLLRIRFNIHNLTEQKMHRIIFLGEDNSMKNGLFKNMPFW